MRKKKVLRIRYKDNRKFGSKLILSGNHRSAAHKLGNGGRILKVEKVSYEELFKVGEYFPGDALLKELSSN